MKIILYLFSCLISFKLINAQNVNLHWTKAIGNTTEDNGSSLITDASGNVYVTGEFSNTVDFDPGPGTYNLMSNGGFDIFIAKYSNSGSFIWAAQIGSTYSSDNANSITIDGAGSVLLTGVFGGTVDFDPGVGTFTVASSANYNSFILKLDANGNFIWAKTLATTGLSPGSVGYSIKTDINNNVYSTGWFQAAADFDPGPSTYSFSSAGLQDVYILKLDASGNFIWAKQIGGSNSDDGLSISLDGNGNIYTTGFYNGTVDFDPGTANTSIAANGAYEIFVLKLNGSGNFVWAKSLGGSGMDQGKSVQVDASGNVYTTGVFNGVSDFDPGPSTYTLDATAGSDIFISKLDPSGNFVWARQFVSSFSCEGNALSIDNIGNIYATGFFNGTVDFDPSANTFNLLTAGSSDIYLLKLDPNGNMIWAKQLGGNLSDVGNDIFVNSNGDIFTTGGFQGTGDFDPEPPVFSLTAASTNNHDIFIHKMNSIVTAVNEIQQETNKFKLFPNPNNGSFNIFITLEIETAEIIIINSLGQKVHNQKITKKENIVITNELARGFYNYIIMQDKQKVSSGKLIIE